VRRGEEETYWSLNNFHGVGFDDPHQRVQSDRVSTQQRKYAKVHNETYRAIPTADTVWWLGKKKDKHELWWRRMYRAAAQS
jgi:hypothetical protein